MLLKIWEILESQAQSLNTDIASLTTSKTRVRSLARHSIGNENDVLPLLVHSPRTTSMQGCLEDLYGIGSINASSKGLSNTIAIMHHLLG